MTLQLGESIVLPNHPFQHVQSITKKISHYIFRFEDKVGQGNFSKVYKGYDQRTNQQVAIKIIQLSSVKSPKLQQLLFSEIQVIQSLNHPNILKCYEVLKSENNCYIITQLCNGGDLQTVLKKQGCLNEYSAAQYIRDIFKGLLYLGQRGIVHRDLKVANVFLHNDNVKIADFGFAKYTNNKNFKDLDIGSPLYMSPQGMIDYMYGMKTDIWSFGVIIYELFHGHTPFCNCQSEYQLKRSVSVPLPPNAFRPDLNPQIRQLIMKCMNVNLQHRPDALALKNDPYISRLLNEQVIHSYQSFPSFTQVPLLISSNKNFQQNHRMQRSLQQQPSLQNFLNQSPHHVFSDISTHHYDQINQVPMMMSKQEPINYNTSSPFKSGRKNVNNIDSLNNNVSERSNKQKSVRFQIPQNQLQNCRSSDKFYPKSNDNIIVPHSLHQQYLSPHIKKTTQVDYILSPKQLDQKVQTYTSHNLNDNSSTLSNSSWSQQNIKKKFPKVLSYNNVNTVTNSLSSNNIKVKQALNTTIQNSVNFSRFDNLDKSYYSNNSNKDYSIIHSVTNKKINKPINFNDGQMNSSKKFGQIIKGDKRNDGTVKSTIKLDKLDPNPQQTQKTKSRSHINYQSNNQMNFDSHNIKKRAARHSIGEIQPLNQSQSIQIPSFIQQKLRISIKRNAISTIIDFKQAVALLHYCRLYFRFLITLKKLKSYPQVKDFRFKSIQENTESVDIFSRYLLTVLNELIQNIKSKEIIYDGQNFKKKQIKQDKLKEVTDEYYKKYYEDINKNRDQNKRIQPLSDKSTDIEWIKEFNEDMWNTLDQQFAMLKQRIQKGINISESYVKHYKNLSFFSVRIVYANQILMRCIKTKNYNAFSDILIENWLGQQFYTEENYSKAKNQYFNMMNEFNPLKGSETNDTQDNCRNDNL